MIRGNKGILLSVLLLSAVVLASCGRNDARKAAAEPGQEAKKGVESPGHESPPELAPGSAALMPEKPTVKSDLQAVFSGNAGNMGYRWERNGEPIEGEYGAKLDRNYFKKDDEIRVVVTANGIETDASVAIADAPPAVTRVTLFPRDVWSGKDLTVEAEGNDPDGDAVEFEYQWIINGAESLMQKDPVLPGQFKRGDNVTVSVTPYSDDAKGETFAPPPVAVQNAPPEFTSTPPRELTTLSYAYQAETVDPDGDPVVYSLARAPEGMKISDKGLIEWTIKENDGGTHEISVVAEDGLGGRATQDYRIIMENRGQ